MLSSKAWAIEMAWKLGSNRYILRSKFSSFYSRLEMTNAKENISGSDGRPGNCSQPKDAFETHKGPYLP